jgi:hypothetical protein
VTSDILNISDIVFLLTSSFNIIVANNILAAAIDVA